MFPCRGRVYRFEAGLVREYIEGKVSIGRVRYLLNIVLFHVGVRITSFPLQFRPIYFLLIPYPLSQPPLSNKRERGGGVRGEARLAPGALSLDGGRGKKSTERGAGGGCNRIKRPK